MTFSKTEKYLVLGFLFFWAFLFLYIARPSEPRELGDAVLDPPDYLTSQEKQYHLTIHYPEMDLTKKGINRIHIGRTLLGGFKIRLVVTAPTKVALGFHEQLEAEQKFYNQIAPKVIISFRVYNKATGKLVHQYEGPMYDRNNNPEYFDSIGHGYKDAEAYLHSKKNSELGYGFDYPYRFPVRATYLEYMNPFVSNAELDRDRIVEFEVIEPMPKSTWHEYHKAKFTFQWTWGW